MQAWRQVCIGPHHGRCDTTRKSLANMTSNFFSLSSTPRANVTLVGQVGHLSHSPLWREPLSLREPLILLHIVWQPSMISPRPVSSARGTVNHRICAGFRRFEAISLWLPIGSIVHTRTSSIQISNHSWYRRLALVRGARL